LKKSGTTFHRPQSTAWSTLCEGDVALHEAYAGHTRYWLVFWSIPIYLRYLWPIDAYLFPQSCKIHRLWPIEFISIDWFPYMNCNSVTSFKLFHVAFYIFVQCSLVASLSGLFTSCQF
jgi:hypothetical protein